MFTRYSLIRLHAFFSMLLLLIGFNLSTAHAGWEPQSPLPTGKVLAAVWGTSSTDVFAVGLGTILHYNGSDWELMEDDGVGSLLLDVWGSSSNDVFAVGNKGIILHYDGQSWTRMTSGVTKPVQSVWGTSATDVFATTEVGDILHYDGTGWSNQLSGTAISLRDISGTDNDNVFAVGDGGIILHYDGTSWDPMISNTTEDLRGVWNIDGSVFAVGDAGVILRYDGSVWAPMVSGTIENIFDVWGLSNTNLFAARNDGTILRYNGNIDNIWTEITTDTTEPFRGVWGSSNNDVFAVGGVPADNAAGIRGTNTVQHFDGSSWTSMNVGTFKSLLGVWDSGNQVFAVGVEGTIMQYDDSTWTPMNSGSVRELYDVWGSSSIDVYAVGGGLNSPDQNGPILHYNGSGWSNVSNGVEVLQGIKYRGVWSSSPNDVFVVGFGGNIVHFNGTVWESMPNNLETQKNAIFWDVWGTTGSDVFAVGQFGVILHYDGSAWSRMDTGGDTTFLRAVWGSSGNDVFAAGDSGTILHYDGNNEGKWVKMTSSIVPKQRIWSLWGSGPNDVFAVGKNDKIEHYDGISWKEMDRSTFPPATGPVNTFVGLWGLSGSSSGDVFVVGDGGTIAHFDGKASQAISFAPPASKDLGDAPFTISATGGGSLNQIIFTSKTASVCTVSDDLVTLLSEGDCLITADQAGNTDYSPAPQVTGKITITSNKETQTIVFTPPASKNFDDAPFEISATGGDSGNPVLFSTSTIAVCTVSGSTVTIVSGGDCVIVANQAGNETYVAAQATGTITINKLDQMISFDLPDNDTFSNVPFTISATSTSGLIPTFSSQTAGVCTVSDNDVSIISAGTCTIAADQAGDDSYNAAPQVTDSMTINKAEQSISFSPPASKNQNEAPFLISATSSSGLTPVFSSQTTDVCTVSGNSVTLINAGDCTIAANQAGDNRYNAATEVIGTIVINAVSTPGLVSSVTLDHTFQHVDIAPLSENAVIITGPPSFHGKQPGVIRVQKPAIGGFELRFQEWEYLDGFHKDEIVPYIVLEKGRHTMSDGSIWEVGTFALDGTAKWIPQVFQETFTQGRPQLFMTIQSSNGGQAVTVRGRNVTSTGFEAALFEQELLMDGHKAESIGYLAIYSANASGQVDLGAVSLPYNLQRAGITHQWQAVLSSALKVEEEQSADEEIRHKVENLDVLGLGSYLFAQDVSSAGGDPAALRQKPVESAFALEWGTVLDGSDAWSTVPLQNTYTVPVVVAYQGIPTSGEIALAAVMDVTSDSFKVKLRDWNYLSGQQTLQAPIHYLVVEQGHHTNTELGLEIAANTLSSNTLLPAAESIAFSQAFAGQAPAVFANVMNLRRDTVVSRINNVVAGGFDISLQEQELFQDAHGPETISWIAIAKGATEINGRQLEVSQLSANHIATQLNFTNAMSSDFPVVFGNLNTVNESDPAVAQLDTLSATHAGLLVQEEQSSDVETIHAVETISVFLAE